MRGDRMTSPVRDRARTLRRDQTEAERRLWARLRDRQLESTKFRRQQPIGPFIADFCCTGRGVVIELDGANMLSGRTRIVGEPSSLRGGAIVYCDSGTMK